MLDGIAVIEVQLAASLAITVRRDDEVEGLGADFGGGESAFGAEGDDGAAADVQGISVKSMSSRVISAPEPSTTSQVSKV